MAVTILTTEKVCGYVQILSPSMYIYIQSNLSMWSPLYNQSLSTRHLSFWTKFWKIIPYMDHVNTTFVKWTEFWKTIPYTDSVDTTFVKWTKFWKAIPYTDHVNTTFVKYKFSSKWQMSCWQRLIVRIWYNPYKTI
jgi:hypothetical protein